MSAGRFEKVTLEQFEHDWLKQFPKDREQVREIYEGIALPKRATKGSAGYDFTVPKDLVLGPKETVLIPTGIRAKIEDGYVLVLKLADPADDAYEWLLQNHYENVIEVSNETNEGGVYTLTMDAAMEEAGNAQIALEYTDAWDEDVQETVVMDLFVNESGEISVETAFKA